MSDPADDDVLPEAPHPSEVFVLSRPHGTVRAAGASEGFTDAAEAADALRGGRVGAITGAIPFDAADTAALLVPETIRHTSTPLRGRPATPHRVVRSLLVPAPDTHRARVAGAIDAIDIGELDKVVLARSMEMTVEPPVVVADLLAAFAHGNADHNAFAVDVGVNAEADRTARWLLGASPEVLLRKQGLEVTCRPYAGSASRSADPAADRAAGHALLGSEKDRAEHAFVVDHVRDVLESVCRDLAVPDEPVLTATGEVWHLSTPIRGTLADPTITALDLALLLSPTPAVCGTPEAAAAQFISTHEEPRGLYAGAVGWCGAAGDGEWMVTIRCLELSEDLRHVRTWAGGGIVAGSDPQNEFDETSVKLSTVLNALGVGDLPPAR
ncbi:isochorismate synthase [Gordonia sp. NPDC003425]